MKHELGEILALLNLPSNMMVEDYHFTAEAVTGDDRVRPLGLTLTFHKSRARRIEETEAENTELRADKAYLSERISEQAREIAKLKRAATPVAKAKKTKPRKVQKGK